MNTGAFPYWTAAAAVFLAVLQMLLLGYTALGRGKFRVGLGDGDNPAMLKRIRMHGNLAENAPLFLILLGLVEISGQWALYLPWIVIAFAIMRVSHLIGIARSAGVTLFRFLGSAGTALVILALAAMLAITLSRDTQWLAALPHG
jgi:uncharacterized membrane protein YecN with MAPEG domain